MVVGDNTKGQMTVNYSGHSSLSELQRNLAHAITAELALEQDEQDQKKFEEKKAHEEKIRSDNETGLLMGKDSNAALISRINTADNGKNDNGGGTDKKKKKDKDISALLILEMQIEAMNNQIVDLQNWNEELSAAQNALQDGASVEDVMGMDGVQRAIDAWEKRTGKTFDPNDPNASNILDEIISDQKLENDRTIEARREKRDDLVQEGKAAAAELQNSGELKNDPVATQKVEAFLEKLSKENDSVQNATTTKIDNVELVSAVDKKNGLDSNEQERAMEASKGNTFSSGGFSNSGFGTRTTTADSLYGDKPDNTNLDNAEISYASTLEGKGFEEPWSETSITVTFNDQAFGSTPQPQLEPTPTTKPNMETTQQIDNSPSPSGLS